MLFIFAGCVQCAVAPLVMLCLFDTPMELWLMFIVPKTDMSVLWLGNSSVRNNLDDRKRKTTLCSRHTKPAFLRKKIQMSLSPQKTAMLCHDSVLCLLHHVGLWHALRQSLSCFKFCSISTQFEAFELKMWSVVCLFCVPVLEAVTGYLVFMLKVALQ